MLGLSLSLAAVPAKRDVQTVRQPDGTTLQIKKVGDERLHFMLTEDDMLLTCAPDGTYCYAYLNASGLIESTGIAAANINARAYVPQQAQRLADIDTKRIAASPRRIAQSGVGIMNTTFPGKGSPNVLIVLVQYTDVKFTLTNPAKYFESMLNEPGFNQYGGTGSCKDYFTENSGGQFTPHFDLYGPVTLPKPRSYYGGNDFSGTDKNAEDMVVHAIQILDETVDFSKYDNDGDGKLDNVYVIYAGQGEASYGPAGSVWPHSWDLSATNKAFTVDGVLVDHYACSNEWLDSRPDGIGTFVHEFSHVMGLPDFYNTANMTDYTPDRYSVLDYGPYNNDGCTPPAYGLFERNALGWAEPRVITGPLNGELEHVLTSNTGYLVPTKSDHEFFLLENRQQEGWDKYIPGHGMLVWHIDYNASVWDANCVNNDPGHQYADIEEAVGCTSNDLGIEAGYTFPGAAGITEFTDDTTPSMRTWANEPLNLPITEIKETDGIITFLVDGGTETFPLTVPVPFEADKLEKGDKHFIAAWEPVEHALDYEVSVYAADCGKPSTATADMGSGISLSLPDGWASNSNDCYNTTSNYGEAAPSLKLAKDKHYLLSPKFDSPVTAVSFWRKGMNTDGSKLTVYGLVGNNWVTISVETPEANKGGTVNLDDIPAGVTQIKFEYTKEVGNLALDDVVITTGVGDMLLSDYIDRSSGGATSMLVDKLIDGYNTYRFKVRAVGERRPTAYSGLVTVVLPTSGIQAVGTDETTSETQYFDMLGRKVLNPAPGQILIRRRGTETSKIVVR